MSQIVSGSRRKGVKLATMLVSPLLVFAGSQAALAQSTGTQAAEGLQEVVVTGRRAQQIGAMTEQTAAKSRVTLTGEYIQKLTPGNTFLDSINQTPGLNFTNNDAYGTSGGNLRLRSFDGNRISLTFDGIPLNDTGNYAIYSNQQIDPELIDAVDVNLGTTDVDSPTASATGGTINARTRKPTKEMGGLVTVSAGEYNFRRYFGLLDTGAIGPWGTRAYIAASSASNDKFKGPGGLYKRQFNARIYQDVNDSDFIAVAFHFNRNRNNFYRTTSEANFAAFGRGYDNIATCTRPTPTKGVADNEGATPNASTPTLLNTDNPLNPGACTNYYGLRVNPSDTGNIRVTSLWHLSDKLRLSVDPSFQYVLANGGGTTTITETPVANNADRRVVGNTALAGFDLNGDGDILDTVRFYSPSNTNTKRYGVNASLIWDVAENQRIRFAYTLDYGKHRQTGQFGYLDANGNPENVFGGRQGRPVILADGSQLRSRDRFSIAELNQFAADYRGKFMNDKLTLNLGVRAPYFKRELNQYCYTQDTSTNVLCTTQTPVATRPNGNVVFVNSATAVQYIAPFSATAKFDKVLPNVGLTYAIDEQNTVYTSYSEGLSAPRTDSLYGLRRLPDNSLARVNPNPETTQSYDLGWRFRANNVMASVAAWQSKYQNRIVSSFDADLGFSVDRNIGDVDLSGYDAQIAYQPYEWMQISSSASRTKTKLLNNLQLSATAALPTAGKSLVETPDYTFGGRIELYPVKNFSVGLQGKYVGKRWTTDMNDASVRPYSIVDLDARYQFALPNTKGLSVQLNISNLFDEQYFNTISSTNYSVALPGFTGPGLPNLGIGAPRTASLSFQLKL